MRAVLIDPTARTVTEVEHDGDYKDIYRLIEADPFDVRPFGVRSEAIYFDDEGLLRTPGKPRDFFILPILTDPISGKALIVGTDEGGNSVDSKVSVKGIEASIEWKTMTVVGWTPVKSERVKHPLLGEITQIIGARPIFDDGTPIKPKRDISKLVNDDQFYAEQNAAHQQVADFLFKGRKRK